MKHVMLLLASSIASVICVSGAIWLASESKEGWGWLLFMAFVLSQNLKFKGD